jgi:hypothetical protein
MAALAHAQAPCTPPNCYVAPALETNNAFTGFDQFQQGIEAGPTLFVNLPVLTGNANFVYCSDCQQTNPCLGGGTGAMATYQQDAWSCSSPTSSAPIMPIYLNAGTPVSQANECFLIVTDSSGGVVTASAVLRWIDLSSVGHDKLCIITSDTANPIAIGTLVFPSEVAMSTNSSVSQMAPGEFEILSPNIATLALTNNSGTRKSNILQFRSCVIPLASCGTDAWIEEDFNHTNKIELAIGTGGDGNVLYIGNVLNSTHPGIWYGGSNADTGAYWGINRILGKLSHFSRLADNADMWDTLTLVAGTASYTFNTPFLSTARPICQATWQSIGTLTGIYGCHVDGSTGNWTGITITSTVNTDTATFAYEIKGNEF